MNIVKKTLIFHFLLCLFRQFPLKLQLFLRLHAELVDSSRCRFRQFFRRSDSKPAQKFLRRRKQCRTSRSVQSSHGFRRMHSSPTFTPGTTARMMVPTTCSTRPRTSTEAVDCTASSRSAPIYSKAIGHPSVCQTISARSKQAFAQSPLRKGRKCGRGPKTSFLKPCRATAHTAL